MTNVLETYVIHVTKKCNCDCLYCYEKDKTSTYTWDEVRRFIDNIVKHKTNNKFNIEFLGGEPMLRWDLVRKSYEYIEDIKEVKVNQYLITNNGTILTDDVIEYLNNNPKLYYTISLDGHKTANQLRVFKNNKNTYDIVANNIKKLVKNNINFGVHLVTHPFNVGYLYDSIYDLYNLGARTFGVGIIESTIEIDDDYIEKYICEMNKISDDIIDDKLEGINIIELLWTKPKTDVRTYIKDSKGKLLGESYGRSGNDLTTKNVYDMNKCSSGSFDVVYDMRKTVYEYYQNSLKRNSMI